MLVTRTGQSGRDGIAVQICIIRETASGAEDAMTDFRSKPCEPAKTLWIDRAAEYKSGILNATAKTPANGDIKKIIISPPNLHSTKIHAAAIVADSPLIEKLSNVIA